MHGLIRLLLKLSLCFAYHIVGQSEAYGWANKQGLGHASILEEAGVRGRHTAAWRTKASHPVCQKRGLEKFFSIIRKAKPSVWVPRGGEGSKEPRSPCLAEGSGRHEALPDCCYKGGPRVEGPAGCHKMQIIRIKSMNFRQLVQFS